MSQSKSLLLPALVSAMALQAHAQDLNGTIANCADVGCPENTDGPYGHCTVSNMTFGNIALTRIAGVPDSLNDFSLVKGVEISGKTVTGNATFTSTFYLGTPQDVKLDEVHGCVVVFEKGINGTYDVNGAHTCSEVVSQSCIDAVQDRGSKAAEQSKSDEELCRTLQADFDSKSIDECKGDLSVATPSAVPISSLQNLGASNGNDTSDCWPILPKSANLANISTQVFTADGPLTDKTNKNVLTISPLLTVFSKSGNGTSIVDETVSRLTCLALDSGTFLTESGKTSSKPSAGSRFTVNTFAAVGSVFALLALLI